MKAPNLSYRCDLTWKDLPGDSNMVRHCDHCDKNVYNLSGMTRAQAKRLLNSRGEKPCVHFASRDGRIVHDGDPLEQLRRQRTGAAKLLAGALTVQMGFMALGGPERVLLDPFISGVVAVVKTCATKVQPKYEMGNRAVDTQVEF